MNASKAPRGDALWPWYCLTAAYLGFGALVLYDRWGEVGSLFEPPGATPGRLPLNSIGDILAGFFAPLAFLWLFVATQLQRKELRLQREELADTRAVLNEQRLELERTARESNAQTAIMQRTLESSLVNVAYEEFGIKIYFLGRVCVKASGFPVYFEHPETGATEALRFLNSTPAFSQSDQATVDVFFEQYRENARQITNILTKGFRIELQPFHYKTIKTTVIHTYTSLDELLSNERYINNDLVLGRINGLGLMDLRDLIRLIMQRINEIKDPEYEAPDI